MFNWQLRVELSGDETQKVFDQVLTNLAREAPPVPGFRRQKGGIIKHIDWYTPASLVQVVTLLYVYSRNIYRDNIYGWLMDDLKCAYGTVIS
jgi:hypothetical protein